MRSQLLALGFFLVIAPGLAAQEKDKPLAFGVWKDHRIVEAQNSVARLSNKILRFKSESSAADKTAKKLEALEKDLRLAQESLNYSKDLEFKDYIAFYLSGYLANNAALTEVASKLSADEIVELLKISIRGGEGAGEEIKENPIAFTGTKSQEIRSLNLKESNPAL